MHPDGSPPKPKNCPKKPEILLILETKNRCLEMMTRIKQPSELISSLSLRISNRTHCLRPNVCPCNLSLMRDHWGRVPLKRFGTPEHRPQIYARPPCMQWAVVRLLCSGIGMESTTHRLRVRSKKKMRPVKLQG